VTSIEQSDQTPPFSAISGALQQALRSWDFLEWLPIGVYVCDLAGAIVLHNKRAVELWGRAPLPGESETAFWLSSHSAVISGPMGGQTLPVTNGPVSDLLTDGRPVRDREYVIQRPNGTRATFLANLDPLFDDKGRVIGGVNCFQDITRRKRVETIRRERERQFRDLLEALPVSVYTTDPEGRLTFYNKAAATMWGQGPDLNDKGWCESWALFLPDGAPMRQANCLMGTGFGDEPAPEIEAQLERPDGTRVPFIAYPTLLRDKAGTPIGAVNMMVDISERKQAEVEQKTLMDELNHRVKNTLATVQSVASQTFRKAQVPFEIRDLFERRIFALSKAHNQLSSTRWTSADLRSLAAEILEPYQDGDGDSPTLRIAIDGPSVDLAPHAALTIAMALNELATNAAKYGALSVPSGQVTLEWKIEQGGDPRLVMDWREAGGPPVVRPQASGFGTRFVERGMAQQLKGSVELDFNPAGLRCRVTIPLAGNGAT
jgi:PAS domain S-box-containing protein